MEAWPSMIMEESIAGNTRLESAQRNHSIFLSHSGCQKAFVHRVRDALVRNAYFPFFDEDPDCLPKGERFAQRVKDESQRTDVAVVVLSNEYFESKWPMIELAIFIKERRRRRRSLPECKELKILPLFMGLSVEEFRSQERRISWLHKWKGLGTTNIVVSEWEEAVKDLGGDNGLEYWKYKNEEDYIDSIVSAIFKLVSPDLKWEDTDVKGKSKLHQAVAKMFASSPSKTRFHNIRAIGIYGMGGTGKTTMCKSLCNDYHVKFNGKVWHAELGKQSAEEIQKDVLRHLVGTSETLLNTSKGSKDPWRSLLRKKTEYKVFLAIDNVWNEDVSREQAEALLDMGFHPDSLVIITSRSRELLEWLGIHKECCYEMPMLDKDDATAVLLQSAAPGYDIQSITEDYQRAAVEKVVERCFMTKGPISSAGSEKQYVPLALEVLGRQLRLPLVRGTPTQLDKWVDNLDLKWSDQKQHAIFSVLRLSYDNLRSSTHKSIFFDVALFVPRQQDNTSASVNEVCKWLSMVYRRGFDAILRVLEDLERAGLVERWQAKDSPIGMHELYCEFAKAEIAKGDDYDNQYYLYHEDEEMPALMEWVPTKPPNLPLRRIHIYGGGFRELSEENLEYLVNVEVLKLDFCFELESLDVRCLKNLRSLELRGCFSLQMVEGLRHLKYLKFFRWNTCRILIAVADFPQALEVVEIYGSKESEVPDIGSFGGCMGLLELTLSCHPLLASVPDLCKLHKLTKVDFSGCCKVEEVRGLGGLELLRHLNLESCKKLRHCDALEKLVKIETLNLGGCESVQLPEVWDLSRLINLRSINIGGILVVRRLVLGSPQLEQLEVMGCRDLRTVTLPSNSGSWEFLSCLNEQRIGEPVESRQWSVECQSGVARNSFNAYKTLNFSNCHTFEGLGGIGLLTSLKYLYLQNCSMLKTLPNLSSSPHLQVVDLSYCCMLEDLGDIGPLRALQYLYLQNCRSLKSLPDVDSPCLKLLDLSCCVSLRTVPNLSNSSLLEVLNVKGCVKLSALSQMTTPYVVIDVSECWSLERIPILNDLARLELDVTVGDIDPETVENTKSSGLVLGLKLTCQRDMSRSQTPENVEMWKQHLCRMVWRRDVERQRQAIMEILERHLANMLTSKDATWELAFMEMLRLDDAETWKQGLVEMLTFKYVHTRKQSRMGMVWSEDIVAQKQGHMLLRFKEDETRLMKMLTSVCMRTRMRGLLKMLRPEDTKIRRLIGMLMSRDGKPGSLHILMETLRSKDVDKRIQDLVEMLSFEDAETKRQGSMLVRIITDETQMQGLMKMLTSDDNATWKQGHRMLSFEDVETWKQGLMEMLWSEDTETRKQGLMEMFRFKDVETRKQCFMMPRSKDIETSDQDVLEMLRSKDVEKRKKGIILMLSSRNVEIRKQYLMEMLGSKHNETRNLGLLEMLRSEDFETRKQGLLEVLRSRKLEIWKHGLLEMLEVLVRSQDAIRSGMIRWASANENDSLLIQLCGDDVRHFKNMSGLLDLEEWRIRQFVFPQITRVKFQSVSISSASSTILPSSFACTISKLEIIKCSRLRCLSNLYLPALETLVISQCDELESLPEFRTATALKHLTIRDFRQGPRFQFLSHLSQPLHAYPKWWDPCSNFKNLVELNFDCCVGLGGLEHWGPLPALESLVIKDCNTITQLPDLRRSLKLSSVVVMNCGRLKEAVNVGSEALRFFRIEGCGDEKLTSNFSSREELCLELENAVRELGVSGELTRWLRRGEEESFHLDMFSGFDFSLFQFTGPSLWQFNILMEQWARRLPR